jgi:nicotinamide-nucleotide amidase
MSAAETLDAAVPAEVSALAEAVLKRACAADLTLATAESCTGGLLASLLTDVDGYAHAFERGFVVYSERSKQEMLGVSAADLRRFGAVSETVARAMAEGALAAAGAQIAVAVTGFAGRGAPGEEPGLVHVAVKRAGRPTAHREEHFVDIGRGAVRVACLRCSLEMLSDGLAD